MKWIWRVVISLFLLLCSFSGLFGGFLQSALGLSASVEIVFGRVLTDHPDGALLRELFNESSSDGAVHLELLHKAGAGNDQNLGDFLATFLEALLIKENIVVKLVFNLNLGPGLLLSFTALLAGSFLLGLRALGGGSTCIFTTLLLFGLPDKKRSAKKK